jgi:hypothetical protein
MSASRTRTLVAAAIAAGTLTSTGTALASPTGPGTAACRIEIPLTVDDAGLPAAVGAGTAICQGRLGASVLDGKAVKARVAKLRVVPAPGGGYMISRADVRMELAAVLEQRHNVLLNLTTAQKAGTSAFQPLGGYAVDKGRADMSVTGVAARIDQTTRALRKRRTSRLGIAQVAKIDVVLRDAQPVPPTAPTFL